MKKLKKFWIIFLVILQVGVPVFSAMTLVSKTTYATENNSSEMLEKTEKTETTEQSEKTEDTVEDTTPTTASAEEKKTTSSSVEPQITDDEPTQENKSASLTGDSTEPQKNSAASDLTRVSEFAFGASIQSEGTSGMERLSFRDDSVSGAVSANWKVLRNEGYNLRISISGYPFGSSASTRQVKVVIPRGLLVRKQALDQVREIYPNVNGYTIIENEPVMVNEITANFQQRPFVNTVNGTNEYSTDYYTGAIILFDLNPEPGEEGFNFNVLPNFEDQTDNSPNFWTGISGDSLTRDQPLEIDLIEDGILASKQVLDNIYIPSNVSYPHVTGNPRDPGSIALGPQTLGEVLQATIQTRLRNDENMSNNAYYVGNAEFKAYVPYKKLANGNYLSAELVTDKMDDWISEITRNNNNQALFKYSSEKQADGRVIVTYSFADDQQEYLLRSLNLQMYYRYFEAEDSDGNKFDINDEIFLTQTNLGQTFYNYQYDENGEISMGKREVTPLSDSNVTRNVSGNEALALQFIQNGKPPTSYSTIFSSETATSLLGYTLIENTNRAEGETEVNYQFDIGGKWNYGVTTVQFWTVDSNYNGSLLASRNYTYNFNFVLQRKNAPAGEGLVSGTYSLTPSIEYENVKINRDENGIKDPLLGYPNERYYYYVNREMLVKGIADSDLPEGFDLNDYYIKELTYDLPITNPATANDSYVSGVYNRPKESGGQIYGHTFKVANNAGQNRFGITPKKDGSETLQNTQTTRIVEKTSSYDLTLFLEDTMAVKDKNGKTLRSGSDRVNVGESVSVSASARSCFYPYGATSYSPDPVFIIRTPVEFDLDVDSIKLNQNENPAQIGFEINQMPVVLNDGSKIYCVKPTNSKGLGFYDENRNEIGEAINIDYKMKVNIAVSGNPIKYRDLLFIADANYANGIGESGSYAKYSILDSLGIAEGISASEISDQVTFYYRSSRALLMTTSNGSLFNINPPVLDFDIETGLTLDEDVKSEAIGGVLDKGETSFDTTFSMNNVKQNGYVDSNGRFMFYLPIAKKGVKPEWITSNQINDFSLMLTGPVELTKSTKNVTYEIMYTTATNRRFNNGAANFEGPSDQYAEYVDYDTIVANGDLDNVTMVKVVARLTPGNEHIVPFNEEMSFKMPLAYSSSDNPGQFGDYTGELTEWTPYVVQYYTLNGSSNEFRNLGTKNTVRIRYRPEKFEEVIWAYNENDYRPGTPEADLMNKVVEIPLPNFRNKNGFELQINKLLPQDIVEMVLEKTDAFVDPDANKSVSFGNSHFGFDVGLNNNGNHDLFDAQEGIIKIGKTLTSDNKLSYKIYNGDNINNPNGDKSITIKYNSINDAGEITDDIEFEVTLKILRKPSIIDAETALIAGKEYSTISDATDNSNRTLQDGAFTFQFAFDDTTLFENQTLDGEKIYLEFGSDGLPSGDTILMKVQSSKEAEAVTPEYYYYKNKSSGIQNEIKLTDFVKMGTTTDADEHLTVEKISSHISEADDGALSYLFIFDFANNKKAKIIEDTISLKFDGVEGWTNDVGPKFKIEEIRKISNLTENGSLNPSIYEQREPINVKGKFDVDPIENEVVDAYNLGKSLSLSLKLKNSSGQLVNWPQGAMIQIGDNLVTPTNIDGILRFIYNSSTDKITNSGGELPYDFKIFTDLEPLATGNYQIEVEAFKDLSQTHPLGGDPVLPTGLIEFNVKAPTSGIRVSSGIEERLVYSSTDNQSAEIKIETADINKVTATLEKKEGTLYKEVTAADVSKVLKDGIPTTIPVSGDLTVSFKNSIDADDNGEYRIVFKGYNDKDELLYETNWTFIVCNPPN